MGEPAVMMTLRIGATTFGKSGTGSASQAFTLIELITVMTVLAFVLALSAPWLSKFRSGRTLTEESRRFLALTRYARSEAVARSVPLKLWLDVKVGRYGLEPLESYEERDWKPIEYKLAEGLSFDLSGEPMDRKNLPDILFLPDGGTDEESLERVCIRNQRQENVEILMMRNRMSFGIPDERNRNDDVFLLPTR
jgi:prepilin-type N-terminal cleavage/methylation domain-containing protein